VASGDFVIWMFPNAGNPRKVQRYASDWAVALRQMERVAPEILIPGHGPVIFGHERAAQVLRDGAEVLEHLVRETLTLMNGGARPGVARGQGAAGVSRETLAARAL
jgi:glyoxylase-like metal-dependent hydrolase (beta-lactamase superfamily II)